MRGSNNHDGVEEAGRAHSRRKVLKYSSALAGVGISSLAGCSGNSRQQGSDGGSTPTATPTATDETQSSKVQSAKLAAAHYPLITESMQTLAAIENGYFRDYGVKIEDVTSFSGGGTTVRGVVTGGLAAGKGALMAAVKAYLAGAPLKVVGLMNTSSVIDFEVLPDSDIESIQDAKGKKIALSNPGGSSEAVALNSIHKADGITLDDVTFEYAGGLGEAITALKEGVVDITFNVIPKSTALLTKGETRRVWNGREYAPNTTEHIMLMGSQLLEENPQVAKGVIRGHVDGMKFVRENQDEAAQMWAEAAGLPPKITQKAMADIRPTETFHIELREEVLKSTAEAMKLQGIIDTQPPWKKLLDQRYLPEDLQVDWIK